MAAVAFATTGQEIPALGQTDPFGGFLHLPLPPFLFLPFSI